MPSSPLPDGATRGGPAPGAAGFTLIEMIVVLAVLGLMLGILVARGPTRSATIDLDAASRRLSDVLRQARGRAISTDLPVRFSAAQARRAVVEALPRDQAAPVALFLHTPPDDPRGEGSLRFDPDGGANGARIVIAEGHEQVSISVDWLTGRITRGPIRRDDAS